MKLLRKCVAWAARKLLVTPGNPMGPLSLMRPFGQWDPLNKGVGTIPQAIEFIERNVGSVRDVNTNDSVGVTFGSVYVDGRWQRFAIRTFEGVHVINQPSEYVEQYEQGIAFRMAREDARQARG